MSKISLGRTCRKFLSMNLKFFFCICCVLQAVYCISGSKVVERIVAKVNDEVIFRTELDEYLRRATAQLQGSSSNEKELERRVLEQLIEERILLQEAKREEIVISEEELKSALQNLKDRFPTKEEFDRELRRQGLTISELNDNLRKQLSILHLIEKNVKRKIQVTNREIREYYAQHKDEIGKGEEEAKEEIRNLIFDKKFNSAFARWMEKLKKRSVIEIKL